MPSSTMTSNFRAGKHVSERYTPGNKREREFPMVRTKMPDCGDETNTTNSSQSTTTAALSLLRMSRSSRSSSSPELHCTTADTTPANSTRPVLTSHSADELHTEVHLPRSEPVRKTFTTRQKYNIQCCTLPVCLITLQVLLGVTVIVFGITMLLMTPSLKTRDAPYWAGIVLFFAGGLGLYFSAIRSDAYQGSVKIFAVKAVFFTLSVICLFVNTIASAFCGIQGNVINAMIHLESACKVIETGCQCTRSTDGLNRIYMYNEVLDCVSFLTNLRTYLYIQCALNAIGGAASFMVVILLWRSRYMDFHSGLRFYSYSAAIPNHPWSDPSTPPYMSHMNTNGAANQTVDCTFTFEQQR
ncbi:sarcospan-like [Diadema setosum]|uniref:sarcospan-like n=1 Tax=Diadema setosum TaxID=31175 RepID=UPI003B3BD65F